MGSVLALGRWHWIHSGDWIFRGRDGFAIATSFGTFSSWQVQPVISSQSCGLHSDSREHLRAWKNQITVLKSDLKEPTNPFLIPSKGRSVESFWQRINPAKETIPSFHPLSHIAFVLKKTPSLRILWHANGFCSLRAGHEGPRGDVPS